MIIAVYLFSIFLGGSFLYLIKDKIKFNYSLLLLSVLFCIIAGTILPGYWAKEISAIPMGYIILFIAGTLKSPKFIQENDISYGIYIYAWPIQCVISCIFVTFMFDKNILLYMFISFIATASFSTLSWFLIEKPILNRVR